MGVKIGWPDRWRDYSAACGSSDDSLRENWLRANRFERAGGWAGSASPWTATEFSMTPPTVNARYSPSLNDILFPAGILQPPFFDPDADDAVNYGAIGVVIGHEMTHGFDDSGRQYDADGNLRDWWTPDDREGTRSRSTASSPSTTPTPCVDTVHVNGKLTTGENISDLGGLRDAPTRRCRRRSPASPARRSTGFTPEQRFFLSYARLWRRCVRPAGGGAPLNTDRHSPPSSA